MGNACKPFHLTIDEGARTFSITEMFLSLINLLMGLHLYLDIFKTAGPTQTFDTDSIAQRIVLISTAILIATLVLQSVFGSLLHICGWKKRDTRLCIAWIVVAIPNIILPFFILIFGACDGFLHTMAETLTGEASATASPNVTNIVGSTTTAPNASDYEESDYLEDTWYVLLGSEESSTTTPEDAEKLPDSLHVKCGYWSPIYLYLLYPIYGIWIMIAFIKWVKKNGLAWTTHNAVAPDNTSGDDISHHSAIEEFTAVVETEKRPKTERPEGSVVDSEANVENLIDNSGNIHK